MNRFKEISMVAVNETSKYCGVDNNKDGWDRKIKRNQYGKS